MTAAVASRRVTRPAAPLNPLMSMPAPLVEPVAKFLLFFSDLIKDRVGLTARLAYWTDEEGMTAADAETAFRSLMKPGGSANIDYGGKLLAALGAAVDKAINDRKAAERTAARNQTTGDLRPVPGAAEALGNALAERGLKRAKPRGPEHLPGNGRTTGRK